MKFCTYKLLMSVPFQHISEDNACFCEGLLTFSEMLSSVETRLCVEDQGGLARLFSWTQTSKIKSAVAVLNHDIIVGRIMFTKVDSDHVRVSGNITGLSPGGIHGFNIQTRGDITGGCSSMLGRYNPKNVRSMFYFSEREALFASYF